MCASSSKPEFKFYNTNYDSMFFNNENRIKKHIEKQSNKQRIPNLSFKSSLGKDFLDLFAKK